MKYFIPFSLLLFAVASCTESTTADSGDSASGDSTNVTANAKEAGAIGGVYSFGSDPAVEAVGSVTVYPESDTTLLFFLDFTRGAPSYNTAVVAGRARLKEGTWLYQKEEPDAPDLCEIEFMFNEKFVQLVTRQTSCGFGANVIVDHVYDRQSTTIPEYFVGAEGDTVLFSNLAKAVK